MHHFDPVTITVLILIAAAAAVAVIRHYYAEKRRHIKRVITMTQSEDKHS